MTLSEVFSVTVDRLCRVRSDTATDDLPFPIDAEGFLDSSAVQDATTRELAPGALVATPLAMRARALVLLGEPGVGKSTEFRRVINSRAVATGDLSSVSVREVNAAGLVDSATFNDLLGVHLKGLPPKQNPARERDAAADGNSGTGSDIGALTIVIDQLDESPLVGQLTGRLRDVLRDRDTSRLHLILGCRTADYPPGLTDVLRSTCGGCTVADLAPLTRQEAVRLASSADQIDGESLVAAAVAAGAGVLASVPLTLGLLVRTYRRTGLLNVRPAELFAQGVTQLLDEHDHDRRLADDETTVAQRTAIAGRIAARLVLSDKRTIWWGPVLEAGDQDLNADSLPDDDETSRSGRSTVTKRAVRGTLRTGLFTGRGAHRVGFRHGSFAAYLTARYLIDRGIPATQLRSLFLVAGADDSRSVPTRLRETAAWLVTLDRSHARWLVEADPESLVAHSPIVDSAEVRELIVDALLRRAGEVELGDVSWARAPRQLDHPRLGAQLLAVLHETEGQEPQDWPSLARMRLAVRLAREARVPELVTPLLDIAANDAWGSHVHLRLLAAVTAFELAPERAAPKLTELLERFADVDYAAGVDPDDELRGALLNMLWPAHISIQQVLPHLRVRRNRNLIGSYRRFQLDFPTRLSEQDLPIVLRWTTTQVNSYGTHRGVECSTNEVQARDGEPPDERPVGGLDTELVDGITERALSGESACGLVREVATILLPRLRRYDHPPLPTPIDVEDEEGHEPLRVRDLRRCLARSLIELSAQAGTFSPGTVWEVVDGWRSSAWVHNSRAATLAEGERRARHGRLLTPDDFVWAYHATSEASHAGDDSLADAFAHVAAYLFDLADGSAAELVYANQDHPAWPHIGWWFEPIPLDGQQANLWRRAHDYRRDKDAEEAPSFEREEFVATLTQLLDDASGGDIEAFWRLAWNLQIEPGTGRGQQRLDDDLLRFPGMAALGMENVETLVGAALHFVTTGHDHADEWLGTNRYDKRGWAGYLALALLERQGHLADVPSTAWPSWVGALIWFHTIPVDTGERDLKVKFLIRAAEYAAPRLAAAVTAYVHGELTQGHLASEVELVDPAWHPQLSDTWVVLLEDLSEAIDLAAEPGTPKGQGNHTGIPPAVSSQLSADRSMIHLPTDESRSHALDLWETMLAALLRSNDQRAVEIAEHALRSSPSSGHRRQLAARTARTLLAVDSHQHLSRVLAAVQSDAELGRETALACATSLMDLLAGLDEEQLAELYRWLSDLFPPETDVHIQEVHFVSPDEQAREWRDQALDRISQRDSEQAVRTLVRLSTEYPDRILLRSHLLRARKSLFASAWSPLSPDELVSLFDDATRRLVRSERELADLVMEVLEAISSDLPTHGELLWNHIPGRFLKDSHQKDAWLPKLEPALSAYIRHELARRLGRRGLVVNREVLVQPTDVSGAGDRTDIQVETTMRNDPARGDIQDRLVVVIEVKGPWNPDLETAQREQLAKRYLPNAGTQTGIYLVGWFPLDQWTDENDYRRSRVTRHSRDDLVAHLKDQARRIQVDLDVLTLPFLLTIPRPHRVPVSSSRKACSASETGQALPRSRRIG